MVALLRGRELRGFLERTSGRFTVTVARSVSGFVLELEASFGGTCVFDPTELTHSAIADIAAAAARAGCALLLYVPLDTAVTEKALSVLDDVEAELVFAGIDDDPDIIALRCDALHTPSLASLVLHDVLHSARELPSPLRASIVALFCAAPLTSSARSFVSRTHLERRTVERWLRRAEFGGVMPLLTGARLTRSWELLSIRAVLDIVARQSAFDSEDALRAAYRRAFGTSPKRALQLSLQTVRSAIVTRMRRSRGDTSE